MRVAAVLFIAVAAVAAAQLATEEAEAEVEFQTEYGWIPSTHCSSYEELQEQLLSVVSVLVECGISKERALNFSKWIVNENVFTVVDEPDMVCIPPESDTDIGSHLGEIAREHMRVKGWEKRRRDDSPQLAFDGTDRDDTLAQKSCCKCSADEYPRGTGTCKAGPCCPNACSSLHRLLGGTAEMVSSCCEESETKCMHKREKQNSDGQRGKRRPPTL